MSVTIGKTEEKSRTDTETRYIEAKLANSSRIERIRDNLYNKFLESDKYRKVEPHLTIIPQFNIPRENICDIHNLVSNMNLEHMEIEINGLSVWPSLKNPRVVLLDVEADLSQARETLKKALRNYKAELINKPVNAHITLFKTDNGYELSQEATSQLQELIWDNRNQWSTHIKYVDIPNCH